MVNKVPFLEVENKIYFIRGRNTMLSHDLAELYGVQTKVLVQSVKRNLKRFPSDFMFSLNKQELTNLRSQIVTSSWGGFRHAPLAFTEQGVAMLSSVLRSSKAISVNITIMRAFVKVRQGSAIYKQVVEKLTEMEKRYDSNFDIIFEAIESIIRGEGKRREIRGLSLKPLEKSEKELK